MSRRAYCCRCRDSLSSAVDETAPIAAKFGPVGVLWTGATGFAVSYAGLPVCMIAWTADRNASLKGPAAAAFANLLDQLIGYSFILPCQWAGVASLLVCSVIAIWKHLGRADRDGDDVTFLVAASKFVSRLLKH